MVGPSPRTPPDTGGPRTYAELVEALQRRFTGLTPSGRAMAERVMSDPEGVAFMTISELAATVGVNESTVVRFAAGLGLDGYPALVRLCRERLREQAQMLRRFESFANLPGNADTRARTVTFDQTNIARTFARIDPAQWDLAVDALAGAATVHILGLRKCYPAAHLLGYLLQLVRDDVRVLTLGAGTLVDELRHVGAGDAFVALSIHRYTADTVRAFRRVAATPTATLTLTDSPASPLARHDGPTFYVDTAGVSVLRSVTAFTSLVQALATDVAARRGTNARSALLTEERLLEEFGTYEAEPGERPERA